MEWILVYVPPVIMSRPGLAFPFSKEVLFFINSSRAKRRSLLIFEMQFPMLLFFMFGQGQPEMKSGHFISYTPYLVHEAMGTFYTIHRCHQASFFACPHPIDPHCYKPHQQAFLLPTKGPGIPFELSLCCLLIHSFPYFAFTFIQDNPKWKVVKKRTK